MGRHSRKRAVPPGTARLSGPRRSVATVGIALTLTGLTLLTQACGTAVEDTRTNDAAASSSATTTSPPPSPSPSTTPTSTATARPATPTPKPSVAPSRRPTTAAPKKTSPPKAKTGAPMSISAPSIDVSGSLRRTSAVNGVVNPPAGVLAWISGYGRVRPGEVGTAVIAGHVVNGRRADVFHDLQDIRRGDKVTVFDASGRRIVYTVTATRVATKQAVSHDAGVWGANRSVRRIALITCDDDDGFRPDGHRVSNFVAIAEAR